MCPNDYILIGNTFFNKLDINKYKFYKNESKIGIFFNNLDEEYFFKCQKDYTFDECIKEFIDS